MNITTALSPGDTAWVFNGERVKPLTVGMVRAIVVDSRGASGLDIQGDVLAYSGGNDEPDNYAAQTSYTEEYMCVETGIGSGSVYTLGEHIFVTEQECREACAEQLREKAKRDADAAEWRRKQAREREAYLRIELSQLEAARAAEGRQAP